MLKKMWFISVLVYSGVICMAGPFVESGISMNDESIVSWAVDCNVVRGCVDISDPSLGYASYGSPADANGPADGTSYGVVSLGDGGVATLTFDSDIYIINGEGDDFAVFENAPGASFLELGFVEVSSDGIHFFGFDAVSLTPTNTQVGGFGTLDATDIHNLAGKHPQSYGTGFDLDELKDVSVLLDVNSITHIRIIDVVGFVEPADVYCDGIVNLIDFGFFATAYGSQVGDADWNVDCNITYPADGIIDTDDLKMFFMKWLNENDYSSCDINGHQINDPWPTPYANPTFGTYTGGFDLDAVGVINIRFRQE